MRTDALFDRFYYSKPGYVGGTQLFHDVCARNVSGGHRILEIGAGPANPTTAFLATLGAVTGLDVSREVLDNSYCQESHVYDGTRFPFRDESFDLCVSNYVLEHVADPLTHFAEAFRVLAPGGAYCFRTPNRWHYITLASSILPHSMHLRLANRLRGLEGAHDPWPTVYRANRYRRLTELARRTGFVSEQIEFVEKEPAYGAVHRILFYPMMIYERLVNSTDLLRFVRVNIFGTFRKPGRAF